MPVGERVWNPRRRQLLITTAHDLLGNMTENKIHLSLCPYMFIALCFCLLSLRKEAWCSILEPYTPVQVRILVLVIVCLSPNAFPWYQHRALALSQGTSESILRAPWTWHTAFRQLKKGPVLIKKAHFFSFPADSRNGTKALKSP